MKYAHIADCHIGAWREPKLREANTKAFEKAVDICVSKDVDFVIISGDLFNTSFPSIDGLRVVVSRLKELKDKDIPVYMIAGSHDFSPSGKTMLDVLESAGLAQNVARAKLTGDKIKLKFTIDAKTGAKITGLLGKKGSLEKGYYENLEREELEREDGHKIFLFHSAITELKPKHLENMESHPLSLLPKNFDYYAGGHPHFVGHKKEEDYGIIAYPGPLFPNNFKEIEDLGRGGFYLVEGEEISWEPVQIYNHMKIKVDCNHKSPEQIKDEIVNEIKGKEFNNTIVTIRLNGVLASGKISDIGLDEIFQMLYDKSAYFVMKNTSGLSRKDFEEIKVAHNSIDEVEEALIKEHVGQVSVEGWDDSKEKSVIKSLLAVLGSEKREGEKVYDFERRVKEDIKKITG